MKKSPPEKILQSVVRFFRNLFSDGHLIYRVEEDDCIATIRIVEHAPLLFFVLLIVLAVVLPARAWLVVVLGMAIVVSYSLFRAVQGARLVHLSRRMLHSWVQVGDRLEEFFELHNDSMLSVLGVEVYDRSDLPGYNASRVCSVDNGNIERWHYKGISTRRGIFRLGPTLIRFHDPLGLFEITREYPHTREVLVVPPILHNLSVLSPSGGGHGTTASRHRSLVETAAISNVRDYNPGDPIRRIHWPLSMHHDSLMIKEFDNERGGDIWLALDMDRAVHVGEGENSTVEYQVIWAASWAWHLLKQGKGVGLYTCAPDPVIVHPARGIAHLWNILRELAPLQAEGDLPMIGLLQQVRPLLVRGHALIVFTPSVEPDWPPELMRPGLRSAARGVVLLDAASFPLLPSDGNGHSTAPLDTLRAMLASIGMPVHLVQHQNILGARPVAPSVDQEYLVTPWGKVVVRTSPSEVRL